jgi:hypothetical protein
MSRYFPEYPFSLISQIGAQILFVAIKGTIQDIQGI